MCEFAWMPDPHPAAYTPRGTGPSLLEPMCEAAWMGSVGGSGADV